MLANISLPISIELVYYDIICVLVKYHSALTVVQYHIAIILAS
jgi:hypothetical protein